MKIFLQDIENKMKLKLKNFRCYENAEFDFGSDGLTLISGSSGKGKSTLMMAIEFALFGSGNKLQTYGKRSCSVELEIADDFKIMRQKCPNRLVVNDEYEDDAGENMIRNRFGTSMLSCYIPQNIRKTFVLMSPAERLEFLESLVLTNVNIQDIKSKTKSLIKKLCDEHNESIGSLKVMTETLATISKPQHVNFPLKVSKENQEKATKNEQIKNKNAAILIKRNEKNVESLTAEIMEQKLLNSLVFDKHSQIQSLELQLQALDDTDVTMFDQKKLIELKTTLQQILLAKSFTEKKSLYEKNLQQINEMKEDELRILQESISKIKIWESLSKDEAIDQLALWKEEVTRLNRKKILQEKCSKFKNLGSLRDTISSELDTHIAELEHTRKTIADIEFQQTVHKCPHCRTQLRFENGQLVQTNQLTQSVKGELSSLRQDANVLSEKINVLRKKLRETEMAIREQDNCTTELQELADVNDASEEELENMREYIRENSDSEANLAKLRHRLDTKAYSQSIISLENKTRLIKQDLDHINVSTNIQNISEEEVRTLISEHELHKDRFERMNIQKTSLKNQIAKIRSEIDMLQMTHLTKWKTSRTIGEIESELIECKACIAEQKKKYETTLDVLDKIQKYTDYIKQYQIWDKINTQHTTLTTKEKDLRARYSAACTFRDKILEAESIAITNTINTINTHAQVYLDHFFPDDPISIRLVAFKETKDSQKPQINLEIEYKGIEHDLSMLSGGEMSRVVLAFTLALSEIHNTPFVMLDESTSSLDQELTSSVVDGLKENFGNKLVLLIAHQVVQGTFDKILKL